MKWATLGKKQFWVIFTPLAAAFVWDLNVPNGLADWVWY